jgi:DNA helicase-2/ATP-dependent DNA helicase PcrA
MDAAAAAGLDMIESANCCGRARCRRTRGGVSSRQAAPLAAFRDMMLGITAAAEKDPVSTVLGLLLDRSGYLRDLREEKSEEADGRIENLMELVSVARQFETGDADPSLASFVDRLALLSDVDKPEGSQAARALLMTMHSAKGLEFRRGHRRHGRRPLPHSRAKDDEAELEEERRLCYVGITRRGRSSTSRARCAADLRR